MREKPETSEGNEAETRLTSRTSRTVRMLRNSRGSHAQAYLSSPAVQLPPSVRAQVLQEDVSAGPNMAGSVRGRAALIPHRKEGERSSAAH